ncbi:leucine-rich repeat domain-containing protein, partial [Metamycoplasma hominis]
MESITIPGSVKEIGESAFSGCENLKEVILNEGLERIGDYAF